MRTSLGTCVLLGAMAFSQFGQAALITNAPMPITKTLTVQPIIARDNAGANPANFMGTAAQEAQIKGFVDTIWAQAGIDVQWNTPNTFDSTEILNGSEGPNPNNPRPTGDLGEHAVTGASATQAMNAINMFFVDIAAGFSLLSGNSAAGLAETPGNTISQFVGTDLLTFEAGRETIASVIAHEIGHNLSLPHLAVAEGLMREGGSPLAEGQRLSAAEVSAALMSGMDNTPSYGALLTTAVPEPSAFLLVGLIGACGIFYKKVWTVQRS